MNTLNSLSLFVGTGHCNAHCAHCAGRVHRKYAPKQDGVIDKKLIQNTLKKCYEMGARYLSLTSSGEPTLSPISVSQVLELVHEYRKEEIIYSPVNLYSNGIRIGEDKMFCDTYFPLWKEHGLTTIYVTLHDMDAENNAKLYGIKKYPDLDNVVSRIHDAYLLTRINLLLSRDGIDNLEKFVTAVNYLKKIGADAISAWTIRGLDDKVDAELSTPESELDKIDNWINENSKYKIRLLREKNRILYQTSQKLTLFPDGTLSNTWCNH